MGMPSWIPTSECSRDSLSPEVLSTFVARRQHQSTKPRMPHQGSNAYRIRLISRRFDSSMAAETAQRRGFASIFRPVVAGAPGGSAWLYRSPRRSVLLAQTGHGLRGQLREHTAIDVVELPD